MSQNSDDHKNIKTSIAMFNNTASIEQESRARILRTLFNSQLIEKTIVNNSEVIFEDKEAIENPQQQGISKEIPHDYGFRVTHENGKQVFINLNSLKILSYEEKTHSLIFQT